MTRQLAIKQPFNLELSLTMGQAFRWRELPTDFYGDGHTWFSGVLGENLIHIHQTADGVEYRVGGRQGERPDADLDQALRDYFREDDDVAEIYLDLSVRDEWMAQLVAKHFGLRLLRQDPWECVVSYICSANNNIPQISRIVNTVADTFGYPVELRGQTRQTFPTAQKLLSDENHVEKLGQMRLGLKRAPNISAAAVRVVDGKLNFSELRNSPYPIVMRTLMQGSRHHSKANGIGGKIADCIALFSLDKTEAFPIDTHIGKAINARYFGVGKPPSNAKIIDWAQGYFGPYAGYAGQFLFCDQPK